jgi:putative component of membrane protein insertase Oxa1/YidC/SpoIIIJ protein YidD
MTASLAPSAAALSLIGLYQRYVSPLKGFCCAHRARKHGRTSSCSQFAKRAIARLGVFAGLPLLQRRFAKCSASARVLEYELAPQKKDAQGERTSDCDPSPGCDASACEALPDACGLAADLCSAIHVIPHAAACHCSP